MSFFQFRINIFLHFNFVSELINFPMKSNNHKLIIFFCFLFLTSLFFAIPFLMRYSLNDVLHFLQVTSQSNQLIGIIYLDLVHDTFIIEVLLLQQFLKLFFQKLLLFCLFWWLRSFFGFGMSGKINAVIILFLAALSSEMCFRRLLP